MRKNALELRMATPGQLIRSELKISKTSDRQDLVADPILTDDEDPLRLDVLKGPFV
jgi:hypothetical protein